MLAIISILDLEGENAVKEIWRQLEAHCGLSGIKVFPYPHITWLGAVSCDKEMMILTLDQFASTTPPIQVKTNGLGTFSGENPVLYLPVVKDPNLVAFHQGMWERMNSCMSDRLIHYSPDQWMPHVTLAIKDVTPKRLACAVKLLCENEYILSINLDNLALVDQEGESAAVLCGHFKLRGQL
jgi:2'-5' RNA ligase